MTNFNDDIITQFRANGGRGALGPFRGEELLLLHTTGRVSGKPRVTPTVHITDGPAFVVMGAAGGADADPQWIANVEASAAGTVLEIEVGDRTLKGRPTVLREGAEYDRLFAKFAESYPFLHEYRTRTERVFPAIRIDPLD